MQRVLPKGCRSGQARMHMHAYGMHGVAHAGSLPPFLGCLRRWQAGRMGSARAGPLGFAGRCGRPPTSHAPYLAQSAGAARPARSPAWRHPTSAAPRPLCPTTTARGEIADTDHIEEMLDTLDLTNIQIPVGTRARYVPATDDPVSATTLHGHVRARMQSRHHDPHAPPASLVLCAA